MNIGNVYSIQQPQMKSIAERHKYIIDILTRDGYIRVADLSHELEVTTATIRKDLSLLESKGLLYRTHGSARPVNPAIPDRGVDEKEKLHREEKMRIASYAASLIEKDDSIIIASGSTVNFMAEMLHPKGALTVVTASLKAALELNAKNDVNVVQIGGVVRKNSFSVNGENSEELFNSINCTKLFLGVDGIDIEYGITTSNIREAVLNRRMIEASTRTIVMTDSSKFGKRGFGKIGNLDMVDMIITDTKLPKATANALEEMGIELVMV